jgi:hypothetical protein
MLAMHHWKVYPRCSSYELLDDVATKVEGFGNVPERCFYVKSQPEASKE